MFSKPFAIYYEHSDWFRPLFAELERRGIPYEKLDIRTHFFDVEETGERYSLFFNRMSPSAYLRGVGHALFYTRDLLFHLEQAEKTRVINGFAAYTLELSKAQQMSLLRRLGLGHPATRVINDPKRAPLAAEGLRFPIVVKANVGGSGAGIVLYNTPADLKQAVAENTVEMGVDGTALVQEFVPKRDGHITRAETLGGKFLYAINVHAPGEQFNLCPADACQTTGGVELARGAACAVEAPKNGMRVESYLPPAEVIAAVERIAQTAKIDVGGIEYMIDDRDGSLVYYDVNALSNFVADAGNVVGFDPHARLVDFLTAEANL